MKPVISICIPTFNRASYLQECLKSIDLIPDTYSKNIEIIVANNFSEDKTQAVISMFQHLESRFAAFKIVYHAKRIPACENWYSCIKRASADYIWLLSDDDKIEPTGVASLLDSQALKEFSLVICSSKIIDKHGKVIGKTENNRRLEPTATMLALLLAMRFVRYKLCSVIWSKKLVLEKRVFDYKFPSSGICLDGAIMIASSEATLVQDYVISCYRLHQNNDCRSGSMEKFLIGRGLLNQFIDSLKLEIITKAMFITWNISGALMQSISPRSGLGLLQRFEILFHIPRLLASFKSIVVQ
jgi:glycosyltransferase involved in cell wall biosynthesis